MQDATPSGPSVEDTTSAPVFRANVIVDGVLRYPPTGTRAVIVGGGVAGLWAALECWRKGIDVVVLEKAPKLSDHGDVLGIGPSGWSTLSKYPAMLQEWDTIARAAHWSFCFENGTELVPPFEYEYNQEGVAQHAAYPLYIKSIIRRSELACMLASQCERLGISIRFGAPVTGYEEDAASRTATAMTSDGRRFSGDVVVAADGIGTKSHSVILGHATRAKGTGFMKYRAVVPSSRLLHHPVVRRVVEGQQKPEVRLHFGGPGGQNHAVTILSEVVCIASAVKDDGNSSESWTNRVTGAEVLTRLVNPDDIDPLIVYAFKAISSESTVIKWLLAMRDPQPKWVSDGGRIVQAGDSAHSFLPTSGNGANTAIESSITLAECLRLGGKEGVEVATRVYQLLRYQRVSIIQQTGLRNRVQMNAAPSADILRQGKWLWSHQPEVYARDNFAQARAHIEHGAPFENTNLPPGHKFEDWTLENEIEKERKGVFTQDLKTNGYWGLV